MDELGKAGIIVSGSNAKLMSKELATLLTGRHVDLQHREVDFVIKEGDSISNLIHVCWDISRPKTKQRETTAIVKAMGGGWTKWRDSYHTRL